MCYLHIHVLLQVSYIYIAQCTYTLGRLTPHPPPPSEHRSLENHYTKEVSYISTMHIYPWQNYAHPPQLGTDALNTATSNLADLPSSIEHRCLEYHYSKLGISTARSTPSQLSIDPLNSITPNLADLPPSQSSRDALHTATPNLTDLLADLPPKSIEHRCLEYHCTKLGTSTPENFYIWKTFYPWAVLKNVHSLAVIFGGVHLRF